MIDKPAAPPDPTGEKKRTKIVVSSSQIENYDLCHRKWWFKSVQKMPELARGSTTFGTVLHGVVERFLRSDDLGRSIETGKPVDLYPPDWQVATEFDGSKSRISVAEEPLVKALIQKAIEEGHLARRPNRKVEAQFNEQLFVHEGLPVVLTGKMDLVEPEEVTDNKTTKNMRYAKSPKALAENTQGLIYGYVALKARRWRGDAELKDFKISHVVFCKDPEDLRVRKTTAVVPVKRIMDHWEGTIIPTVQAMLKLNPVNEWHKIPEPPNMAKACNAFGGCSFMSICTSRETPSEYRRRVDKHLAATKNVVSTSSPQPAQQAQLTTGESNVMAMDMNAKLAAGAARNASANKGTVPAAGKPSVNPPAAKAPAAPAKPAAKPAAGGGPSLQAKMAARAPAAAKAPAASPPKAPAKAAPAAPAAAAPETERIMAPWAIPDCPACSKPGSPNPVGGFNSAGAPCRICDTMQAKAGGLTSKHFTISREGGYVIWIPNEGVEAEEGAAELGGAPEVAAETREPEPAPEAPSVEPEPEAQGEAQGEEEPAEPEAPEDEQPKGARRGPGRPPMKFNLFINCVPVKLSGTVVDLHELIGRWQPDIAATAGAANYFMIDAFRRRDMLAGAAPKLVEDLGKVSIYVTDSRSPEIVQVIDALRPHASMIVEGTR